MNTQRWISGLLGFPLLVAVLTLGNKLIINIVFTIVAIMCLNEYFSCFKGKAKPIVEIGYISALIIPFIHILPSSQQMYLLFFIPFIIVWIFGKVIFTEMKVTIYDAAITFLGIIYIIGLIIFLPIIVEMENGKLLVWYAILSAWGTDLFAYLIGKMCGKHKFTSISPKKSIEGCIGGLLGGLLLTLGYTFVLNTYLNFNISYLYIAIVAICLSIVGQIGDLAASTIKRYAGVKDFSNLIPGHGGMLDRLDSIIFVAPFTFLFLIIM